MHNKGIFEINRESNQFTILMHVYNKQDFKNRNDFQNIQGKQRKFVREMSCTQLQISNNGLIWTMFCTLHHKNSNMFEWYIHHSSTLKSLLYFHFEWAWFQNTKQIGACQVNGFSCWTVKLEPVKYLCRKEWQLSPCHRFSYNKDGVVQMEIHEMPRLQAVVRVPRPCKPCRFDFLVCLGVCFRILTIFGVIEADKYVPTDCKEKYLPPTGHRS